MIYLITVSALAALLRHSRARSYDYGHTAALNDQTGQEQRTIAITMRFADTGET
jgi:hypothetical protein